MAAPAGRDVSCLALTLFFDYLESRGLSRGPLLEGLPYARPYLEDRSNWIDFATFQIIERRLAEVVPDEPNVYYDVGFGLTDTNKALAIVRVWMRSMLSPFQVYAVIPQLVSRFLFTRVSASFERTSRSTLRGRYVFHDGFPPSDAWIETARGIFASVPMKMGVAAARVTARRVTALEVHFDVELSTQWLGPVDYLRRAARRVVDTLRMRLGSIRDAMGLLEETNKLLEEKVTALTEAKSALDEKVRQLTILNEISRAAASELELSRLLQTIAQVVHEQLGRVPTALLMTQGEPPSLVRAASAGLSHDRLHLFSELARPTSAHVRSLVERRAPLTASFEGAPWRLLPLVCREQLLGVLALSGDAPGDAALLEAVAGQLAVAIDNATSYQLVTDLRDNLEVRVQERTIELEAAREALEATVHHLERSDRAMRDFFTNVSHEFRTPLTLILAPLDELAVHLRQAGLGDAIAGVENISRNAQSLLRLINEILDFAKLDAQQMPMHPERFDVIPFVEDIVEWLRPLADRKRIALSFDKPPMVIDVEADPKLLRRAVVNLVSNAIKYVDDGDAVRVRVDVDDDDVLVEVADNGPGIPEDQRERVFERFQRVQDNRGYVVEGSGIGLAMVKEILQLHRGSIELDCPPTGGAVFRCRVPFVSAVSALSVFGSATPSSEERDHLPLDQVFTGVPDDAQGEEGSETLAQSTEISSDLPKVLLVEDNAEMRAFLRRLLRHRYVLLQAEDGVEGLELAARQVPDLVVSDVMMPRMDGYELCRRLKADPVTRNVPVVLVSAMHGTEASVQGFAAGADDFVVKPFSPPELLARIEAQLRLRALQRAVMRMEKETTLGVMAAGIAHEVLNPVNAVLTAMSPLRQRFAKLPESRDREMCEMLLDAVEESGGRIRDVVRAMLSLARRDGEELVLRETKLSDGIRSVLTVLGHKVAGDVAIESDIAWDEPMQCYPELLFQVVMNLVGNAIDAVEERGGTVHITTERAGDEIRIRVRDDGPGVSPEMRERIFAPFFTTKAPGKGTGLGLAIGREIAGLHGGRLELFTPDGGGAEFVLTVPYVGPAAGRPVLDLTAEESPEHELHP